MPTNSEPSNQAVQRHVVLNIEILMVERKVRSVAALQRMLISEGVDISSNQLARIVDNRATLLNLNVVNGLMKVLNCSVHELFGEIVVPSPGAQPGK